MGMLLAAQPKLLMLLDEPMDAFMSRMTSTLPSGILSL